MATMVLVQNAHGQSMVLVPISRAVSLWFKQAAQVVTWFEDKVLWQGSIYNTKGKRVVEERLLKEDGVIVHENTVVIRMPAVIRVFNYLRVGRKAKPAPTTENVIALYGYQCQRCGKDFRDKVKKLSKDHIHPTSRGGKDEWENLTCLCTSCNCEKGDRTLKEMGWTLLTPPRRPMTRFEIQLARMKNAPEIWKLAITD